MLLQWLCVALANGDAKIARRRGRYFAPRDWCAGSFPPQRQLIDYHFCQLDALRFICARVCIATQNYLRT